MQVNLQVKKQVGATLKNIDNNGWDYSHKQKR